MARELRHLLRAQLGEDAARQRLALLLQPLDLLVDVDLGIGVLAEIAQLLDLRLELGDGLFEFEEVGIHRQCILAPAAGDHTRGRKDRAAWPGRVP